MFLLGLQLEARKLIAGSWKVMLFCLVKVIFLSGHCVHCMKGVVERKCSLYCVWNLHLKIKCS